MNSLIAVKIQVSPPPTSVLTGSIQTALRDRQNIICRSLPRSQNFGTQACISVGCAVSEVGAVCLGVSTKEERMSVPLHAGIHPLNRITDRCKNITLPQISFAGGKKDISKN